jgi:hypothetical protein
MRAILAVVLGSGLGCASGASGTRPDAPPARTPAPTPATDALDKRGYELPTRSADSGGSFPMQAPVPVAAETRLARLSHSQYQHTVVDLLGTSDSLDLTFAPDALNGFGFDTSNALRVDARLGPQYRAMAEALAERAASDMTILARIVPCEPSTPTCKDEFLRSFAERAFRRPATADDMESFRQVFAAGASRYGGEHPFRDGVRLTLEVMLQSPEFLYRTESSASVAPGARSPLGDFEVASRLSYFLYDSMPDRELFEAARASQLHTPDQVEAAARRMLRDPRVLDKLVAFHEQAWQFERFARISPDPARYPNAPPGLVQRVRHATRLFVRDILQNGGGLEELLGAPYAYADAGLRRLYRAPSAAPARGASGGRFARVDFDPRERKGLLMQVGYLAANAYSVTTDPIHRGLFVIRNLLCREVPDPPPGATTTPPPETAQPIVTTRDEVSLVTGQSFCPTCHVEINAPGFAFEGFDAVGQRRTEENGVSVDTAATMVLDGQRVAFDGPIALVDALARSKEAHRCYSRRWIEFAYGRPLAESDLPTLDAIAESSLPIAEIIVAIVRSPEFLSRAPAAAEGARARPGEVSRAAASRPGAR